MRLAPLTIQQTLFWNVIQRDRKDAVPRAAQSVRLRGNLNLNALRRGLDEIIRRHEALSTRIVFVAGEPRQRIDQPQACSLKILQCDHTPADEIDNEIQRFASRFCQRRMHIEIGPLFRVRLLRFSEDEHALILVMHHIMSDGASFALFLRELWTLYGDFSRGEEASLSKVPMQYWEYAIWQNDRRAVCLQRNNRYWVERLADATCVRIVQAKPAAATFSGAASIRVSFGELLSADLNELSRKSRVARALVMLAVYACVLSVWYRQRDFVVVTVVSGRHYAQHANVMGLFAYAVPLRMELEENHTFAELLNVVAREYRMAYKHLEAYEHSGLGASDPHVRDVTRTAAVFNWFVTSDAGPKPDDRSPGLTIEPLPMKPGLVMGQNEVKLRLTPTTRDICGDILYRPDVIASSEVEAFFHDLKAVAEAVVSDRRIRIGELATIVSRRGG